MGTSETIYVKLDISYGAATEIDNAGCDGMFVEGIEICTKEIAALKRRLQSIVDEFRLHIDENGDTAEWLDALLTTEDTEDDRT